MPPGARLPEGYLTDIGNGQTYGERLARVRTEHELSRIYEDMIGIIPLTVVFSFIFNNTGLSTLACMLFHFMVNFTGELVVLNARAEVFSILLWFVAAIIVTVVWGVRKVMRPQPLPQAL